MQIKKQSSATVKILNSKEKKAILKIIKNQWNCEFKTDLTFLLTHKNRIYIINNNFSNIDISTLKIDHLGSYFGELYPNNLRLSIEGSQLIGPLAKKNIIELNKEEMRSWLKGNDLQKKGEGFIILKYKTDFIGCGTASLNTITNFVPKNRRILCND